WCICATNAASPAYCGWRCTSRSPTPISWSSSKCAAPMRRKSGNALHAAFSFHPGVGKIVVAVDEDIDPSNEAAVFWAMCYRMKPHKDVHIVGGMEKGHAP